MFNFNTLPNVPNIGGGKRDVTPPVRLVNNFLSSSSSPVQTHISTSPPPLVNSTRSTTPLSAIQLSHSTSLRPSSNPRQSSVKKPRIAEAVSYATFEAHRPISRSASKRKQRRWENMNMIDSELLILKSSEEGNETSTIHIETNSLFNELFRKENQHIFDMFRKVEENLSQNVQNHNHTHTIKKYISKYTELLEYYKLNSSEAFYDSLLSSVSLPNYLISALSWCQIDQKLRQVVEEKILNTPSLYVPILNDLSQLLLAFHSEDTNVDDDWCLVSDNDTTKTNIKLPMTQKLASFLSNSSSKPQDILSLDKKMRLCIKTGESPLTRLLIHATAKYFGLHTQSFSLNKSTKSKDKIIIISKSKNPSPTLNLNSTFSSFLLFHLCSAQTDEDYIFASHSFQSLYISEIQEKSSKIQDTEPPVTDFGSMSLNNTVQV